MNRYTNNIIKYFFRYSILLVLISFSIASTGAFCENASKVSPKKSSYKYAGTVLRAGDGEIVIDDHLIYFSKSVKYHKEGSKGLISKNIAVGSRIGFNLDKDKKISDIWILKKKKK
jgi:hypothetical protein